jgi:hypothetical protein
MRRTAATASRALLALPNSFRATVFTGEQFVYCCSATLAVVFAHAASGRLLDTLTAERTRFLIVFHRNYPINECNRDMAYAYVRTLLVLETLLFAASLLLHLSVFITGPNENYARYGLPFFRATVIVGIPVIAFVRDGLWKNQIKSCPKWMWRGTLILGVYALLIAGAQTIFSEGTFFDQALVHFLCGDA